MALSDGGTTCDVHRQSVSMSTSRYATLGYSTRYDIVFGRLRALPSDAKCIHNEFKRSGAVLALSKFAATELFKSGNPTDLCQLNDQELLQLPPIEESLRVLHRGSTAGY